MSAIVENIAAAFGAKASFALERIYPALFNHEKETGEAAEAMLSVVGHNRLDTNVDRALASEDFAFFLENKPGCYAFLGNGVLPGSQIEPGPTSHQLHSPYYDFNDSIIGTGIAYWISLVERLLSVKGAT